MGSVGNSTGTKSENLQDVIANIQASYMAPVTVSYDIEDEAIRKGYDSAEEMVTEDLTADNNFWTRDDEMVADIEDLGYTVISSPNGESFVIMDDNDNSDTEFQVYYEKAGSSRYITKVRQV